MPERLHAEALSHRANMKTVICSFQGGGSEGPNRRFRTDSEPPIRTCRLGSRRHLRLTIAADAIAPLPSSQCASGVRVIHLRHLQEHHLLVLLGGGDRGERTQNAAHMARRRANALRKCCGVRGSVYMYI